MNYYFSIGTESFMNCSSLKEIIIEDESKNIDTIKFDSNESISTVYPCHERFPSTYNMNFKNVDSLKWQTIKSRAFCNCNSLTKAKFFLGNLEKINNEAFLNCSSLNVIEINSQYSKLLFTENFDINAFEGTPENLIIEWYNKDKIIMNQYSKVHEIKCHSNKSKKIFTNQ